MLRKATAYHPIPRRRPTSRPTTNKGENMTAIRGEAPIRWDEKKQRWACTIDLGRGPNGKRRRSIILDKSRNNLIRRRRERLRQIEDGTYTPGKIPTVATWFQHWLDTIAYHRVRPRVLENYRSIGRNHIPHIGARKLDQLTPTDIRFMHQQMHNNGASDRTIQIAHSTLSKALKDAVREGLINQNPCDRMDRPRANSTPREALTELEAKTILSTAQTISLREYVRWLLALMLGARQAECLGLEWDRVNLMGGYIDLSWQIQRIPWAHGTNCGCKNNSAEKCPNRGPNVPPGTEIRPCHAGIWFTRPKTQASIRIVPLPPVLVQALRNYHDELGNPSHGLVFPDTGGRPMNPKDDAEAWRTICQQAGVRVLTLHSARHTMVSILLEHGVPADVIRQIAGHSSVLSTRNYMHVGQDQARRALETWSP